MSAIDDEDLPVTPEEAAEAEALARVLGKQRPSAALPFDALATARMLQLHHAPEGSEARGHLSQADEQRILQLVLQEAKLPVAARRTSAWDRVLGWFNQPAGRVWALAGSSVALVSVLAISISLFGPMRRESSVASVQVDAKRGQGAAAVQQVPGELAQAPVPEPPLQLLRAQAVWIATPNERGAFARGMREYRDEVYLAMGEP